MKKTDSPSVRPPRIARWLLELFVPRDQVPPLLGDLLEEFSARASQGGMGSARRWYWRQSAKTALYFLSAQLSDAPWQSLTTVLTGVFLLWVVDELLWAMLWGHYETDWPEPLRLVWIAVFQGALPVCVPMLVGWIVGMASKGREMAVTISLSLMIAALRYSLVFHHWRITGRPPLWSILFLGAPRFSLGVATIPAAILLGGLIARKMAPAMAPRTIG